MPDSPKKDAAAPLPDRLVPDPKNPPDLTLLQGWLGASSEDRHRRLYLDPELTNSLEIPEDAIVHTQDIPRDTNPLGGDWVWVKADAVVKEGPGIERLYARFLRGQIQQDYYAGTGGGGAAAAGGGMVGGPNPAAAFQPIRTYINCPSRLVLCRPSVVTICASLPGLCRTIGIACYPSAAIPCPTRICPSAVDACPSAPGGCDPWTIYQQTGTIVQQPDFGGVAGGGGLGFDPGIAAGGFVGGPNPAALAIPRTIIGPCQSLLSWCRPSVLTICITRQSFCQQQVSAAVICQTRICPSAVDACPSAPGGCDPWTIYQQTGTIVQQPDFGGVAGGGLGFDPGMAAGGFVGAPGPGAGAAGPYRPIRTIFNCPTQAVWCRPSQVTICASSYVICRPTIGIACVPSAAWICQTRICPSAVDACPSAPGGCDPWTIYQQTGTIVQQPGGFGGVAGGGGAGFDPGAAAGGFGGAGGFDAAGGAVGAPSPLTAQYMSSPVICQVQTRTFICRPTLFVQQCHTQTPACITHLPNYCITVPHLCQTQYCPTLIGCPSGPVCGFGGFGGGGYPGGGGF